MVLALFEVTNMRNDNPTAVIKDLARFDLNHEIN
jgi:hypothetical protein